MTSHVSYLHAASEALQDHNPRSLLPERIEENGQLVDNFVEVDSREIEKILSEDLKCPICRGPLNTTIAIAACLHRFCSDCFQRSIRDYKQQHGCPICRKSLASRRSSKPDRLIDQLVSSLQSYTNPEDADLLVDKQEDQEQPKKKRKSAESPFADTDLQQQIEEFRKAYLQRVEEFKARQKILKSQPQRSIPAESYFQQNFSTSRKVQSKAPKTRPSKAKETSGNRWRPDPDVLPYFVNNQSLSNNYSLKLPYLKLPDTLQVGDLKLFLQSKIGFPEEIYRRFEILIPAPLNKFLDSTADSSHQTEKWIVLDEGLTMSDIIMLFWTAKSELLLYFRCTNKESLSATASFNEPTVQQSTYLT